MNVAVTFQSLFLKADFIESLVLKTEIIEMILEGKN